MGVIFMRKLLLLALCMCVLFSGCAKKEEIKEVSETSSVESDDWKYGGSIQMACVPVDTLNPLITRQASVADILSLVYEGLFETKQDQTVEPVLAKDYTVSDNNTTYTINIKSGIKFHDGSLLNSEDVVATLDYIFLYEGYYSALKDNIELYYASDSDSVSIVLKRPVADFVNCLDFPILPSGLAESSFVSDNSSFRPVGTGMYCYDRKDGYKNFYLKANPSWHREKKPYIENINVQILSDSDTIISAFDAGIIDILTTSWMNAAEMNLTSSIYNTYETQQNKFTYIGINCACADFDTLEERQYFKSCINIDTITKDIMIDSAVAAKAPLRDNVYFDLSDDDSSKISDKNDSGFPSKSKNGDVILLYNSDSSVKERVANAIKYQMENKGFSVVLDAQPFEEFVLKVQKCEYDLYIGETVIDNSGNLEFMFGKARSGQNICAYRSDELLTLISNLNTSNSKEARSAAWNNFKKYYFENVFQIPLYFSDGNTYVNKRISGELMPDLSNMLSGFENLYINKQPDQVKK